jgi:hypothetical protein
LVMSPIFRPEHHAPQGAPPLEYRRDAAFG